jgi:DNA-binding protein H-NS
MMATVEKSEIEYLNNMVKLEDKLKQKQSIQKPEVIRDYEEMLKDYEDRVKTVDIEE